MPWRLGIRADRVTPGSATLGHEYATAIAPPAPWRKYRDESNTHERCFAAFVDMAVLGYYTV